MWDPIPRRRGRRRYGLLPGAVFGAYILGIVEHLFGGYVSIEFKSSVAFAVIVLVLCVRPSGLFARHYIKKV
jgi:branched-chain amino acid transport system permease protein